MGEDERTEWEKRNEEDDPEIGVEPGSRRPVAELRISKAQMVPRESYVHSHNGLIWIDERFPPQKCTDEQDADNE